MNQKPKLILILLLALALTLVACQPQAGETTPTSDPNAVYTAAAETANARLTELAQITPSATPEPPTATPDPMQTALFQTAEAALTQVVVLSLTPPVVLPTATNVVVAPSGDQAQFVQETIPDGSDYAPGASFTKSWRLYNSGTTTWSTDYKITFVSGAQMATVTSVALTSAVAPGASVDISVPMVAPSTAGNHRGYWQMANAAGTLFGVQVWVDIDVVGTGVATVTPGGPTFTPTSTVTPGGPVYTPTPTPTATSSSSLVSNLTMTVDRPAYAGACPVNLSFTASFTVNQNTSLTYQLEAGSDTPGFQFTLPGAVTETFAPGATSRTFTLNMSSSGGGWVRLHITSPIDLSSTQVFFNLVCQ